MKLTPRLAAIAELVPSGSVIADIGTDHAYLPVYLVLEQVCDHAVAADVKQPPLEQAKETVAAFNCVHKVDLRLGDGLNILCDEDKVDTVVIAGMGGRTIAAILEQGHEKVKNVKRFILQPMKDSGILRIYLAQNGYALIHESLVMEHPRLYEIIVARPGREYEKDLFRLALGPRLIEKKPPLLPLLLREKIRKLQIVRHSLKKAKCRDVSLKLKEVEQEIISLEEVLAGALKRTDSD
jgi:tRNA (adenine22-N1)-methyltransferase